MSAVIGNPADHRSLYGHRSADSESYSECSGRMEAPVGEVPVVSDGYSESAYQIHANEQDVIHRC